MRVVSMVPSWTETLLRAGVNVVGRTRYCIHPPQKITNIPVVGGTKDVSWDLVVDLKPDLVLLDQEENPLEMAEACPLPTLATHVSSLEQLHRELARLGDFFHNPALLEMAVQCLDVLEAPAPLWDARKIPGFMEWVRPSSVQGSSQDVVYMIWKKPWMAASRETYIGSVLEKLGATVKTFPEGEKYPVLDDTLEDIKGAFVLFSSEPYPFHKKVTDLRALDIEGAVVNGECYSWFGVRSLEFLRTALSLD
ncbi:MAG: helical backbone metal receptor [Bdellovibrio sp.]